MARRKLSFLRRPPAVDPQDYSVYWILILSAVVGAVVHALLIVYFFVIGADQLGWINCLSVAIWLSTLRWSRRGRLNWSAWLMLFDVYLHSLIATSMLGTDAGFQFHLLAALPILLFNVHLKSASLVVLAAAIVLTFGLLYWFAGGDIYRFGQPDMLPAIHFANVIFSGTAATLFSLHFRNTALHAEAKLTFLARTDPLTRLHNRRSMMELLHGSVTADRRGGKRFCLVIGDIDHFKRVNDEYGHAAGDVVLFNIARTLKERLRKTDAVARWGGEEFLMLLTDIDVATTERIVNELRERIAALNTEFKQARIPVTMSFGISQWQADESIDQTLLRADNALYRAKHAGRNRVEVADEDRLQSRVAIGQ